MSKEGMMSFFKFMADNKDCQDRVKALGDDFDGLAAYAGELGFDFSPEEMRAHKEKARQTLKNKVQNYQPSDAAQTPGARAFLGLIKLAETDKAVAKELAALVAGSPEALVAFGGEKGFTFTEQDIETVGKDILEQEDELSDEELEEAAGGFLIASLIVVASVAVGAAILGIGAAAVVSGEFS